jgi:hypothetical protein
MENEMSVNQTKPTRRGFFFGAVATGAAVATVAALPGGVAAPDVEIQPPGPAPEKGGGYSLSEHVKRYYKTTRV